MTEIRLLIDAWTADRLSVDEQIAIIYEKRDSIAEKMADLAAS